MKLAQAINQLSSLIAYLNKQKFSTIFDYNTTFLYNLASKNIPPSSELWRPRSVTEWFEALLSLSLYGVSFAVVMWQVL